MRRGSPKKGQRLPLPRRAGRPIGSKRGVRGYERKGSDRTVREEQSEDLSYEIIDHTADIGIRVRGATLEGLFENAGLALFDLLTETRRVRRTTRFGLSLKAGGTEALFVQWLRELLYVFYAEKRVFARFEVTEATETSLIAVCFGERFDSARHVMRMEIKAVTYHELSVEKTQSGWEAQVIFDV
ncbi:MAG: archease [Candidatus Eisenbacteria bacterium]